MLTAASLHGSMPASAAGIAANVAAVFEGIVSRLVSLLQ